MPTHNPDAQTPRHGLRLGQGIHDRQAFAASVPRRPSALSAPAASAASPEHTFSLGGMSATSDLLPTPEDIRRRYGPPRTLGAPEKVRLAMDAALTDSGAYTLIQHAFELGQGAALGSRFMGYAALSSLAQNGLIRACVETVADDMTRAWIDLKPAKSRSPLERRKSGADPTRPATSRNAESPVSPTPSTPADPAAPAPASAAPTSIPAAPAPASTPPTWASPVPTSAAPALSTSLPADPVAPAPASAASTSIPAAPAPSTPAADHEALEEASATLRRIFRRAAEFSGYFGGCLIFIDTGVSGDRLAAPLDLTAKSAELARCGAALRLAVVEPVNIFPGDWDAADPLGPRYQIPEWWWILGRRVHASRLIRVAADEPPALLRPAYNFLGIPQAQVLWDYVLHFQECRTAAARLLSRFSLTVFKTRMDDILFRAGGTRELDARIRYLVDERSNDGVLAIDRETEDIAKIDTSLSGVTDIVRQSLELLAAVNRTPAVKLLGISPSGFNATGESDLRNYNDHIRSRQEKILRDPLRQALDVLLIARFGEAAPAVDFEFVPLDREDAAARAQVRKTRAETAALYLDKNVVSPQEVRSALIADSEYI